MRFKFDNWEQYNRRAKEYKNPVWFSFSNDFATNRNFYDFTDQQRLIFIYLLCEASRQNESGSFSIDLDHFAYFTRQKPKDILSTLEKLVSKQIIKSDDPAGIVAGSCGDRDLAVTEQNRTGHNRTEQDRTEHGGIAVRPDDSASHPECFAEISDTLTQRKVKAAVSESWAKAFPEAPWVIQEIKKALAWEAANTSRKKKDFGRFMTNWLTRGWDSRRVAPANNNRAEQRDAHNRAAAREALRLMGIDE